MSVLVDYGVFPVSQVSVHITRFRGKGIRNGMAFGTDEAGRITIRVGSEAFRSGVRLGLDTDPRDASSGLCFGRGQAPLIEEELATHVEPIARSRAWTLGAGKNVGGTRAGHASGPAGKGDHGLDHTHIWGRTYRGGALFCLLADVEMRRQTKNKKGPEHALGAILKTRGDIRRSWDLSEAFRVGDRATRTRVLQNLYEEMKAKPVHVDLDGL